MHIYILLARAFDKILRIFWNLSLSTYFIIYLFSLNILNCSEYIVADFSLAVKI